MALYASLLFTIINFVAERWQNFVKSYSENIYQLTRAAMTYFLAAALVNSTVTKLVINHFIKAKPGYNEYC